jgi:ABC-2 type transport system permease protein
MNAALFVQTLRQSWRQTLYWGLGLGLMGTLIVFMLPFFDTTKFVEVMKNLPPVMLRAMGVGEDMNFFLSLDGLLAFAFFGKLGLIFLVYPVVMGLRVTTNEEDEGILDMVISLPVKRWRVVLDKFAAYVVLTIVLAGLMWVGLWLGIRLTNAPVNLARLTVTVLNILPMFTLVLAFTVFAGTYLSRRQTVLIAATVFVVGSYVLDSVGALVGDSPAGFLRNLSFLKYYDALGVMQYGPAWGNIALLVGLAAALVAGSLWAFQRRDIGV